MSRRSIIFSSVAILLIVAMVQVNQWYRITYVPIVNLAHTSSIDVSQIEVISSMQSPHGIDGYVEGRLVYRMRGSLDLAVNPFIICTNQGSTCSHGWMPKGGLPNSPSIASMARATTLAGTPQDVYCAYATTDTDAYSHNEPVSNLQLLCANPSSKVAEFHFFRL